MAPGQPPTRLSRVAPRLARSFDQWRRDARMVVGTWRGQRQPLVARGVNVRSPRRSAEAARPLRVVEVLDETPSARSLILRDAADRPLPFVPGQFFTVLVDIGGRSYRRAYSLSSYHGDPSRVRITVKRVAGGLVSNHLNDHAAVGQTLRVLGPSGNFTFEPEPTAARELVLIGGGSGITPLMAIARAALLDEPKTTVTLLFGNRTPDEIIFRAELAELEAAHRPRLRVYHLVEEAPADWSGARGRLDEATCGGNLDQHGLCTPGALYYVCGPEPMMAAARAALLARGVAADAIREERFTSPALRASRARRLDFQPQPMTLRIGEDRHTLQVAAGETVLDAGLAAGLPMKYSCAMGGCGACRVKLEAGQIESEEPNCLTDAERQAGYVLACCSRPLEPIDVAVE